MKFSLKEYKVRSVAKRYKGRDPEEELNFEDCDRCEKSNKLSQLQTLFEGSYKWGRGNLICKSCFECVCQSEDETIYKFKHDGRFLYYDASWLMRFKNPHGHKIFTEREFENLGGSSSSEDNMTTECVEKIFKKVDQYCKLHSKSAMEIRKSN
jgi:hypothetical protein